ncbi:MAG TPA: hypothetical protein VGO31_10755 [Microbacteriaceae bacterium]|jgi:hypothetical protein|nr:hypothetical protein [Microbacteriaceae bacterium]
MRTTFMFLAALLFFALAVMSLLGGDNDQPAYITISARSVDARVVAATCLAIAGALATMAFMALRRTRASAQEGH